MLDCITHCLRERCQRSRASVQDRWRSHLRSEPQSSSGPEPAPSLPFQPLDEHWPPGARQREDRWRLRKRRFKRWQEGMASPWSHWALPWQRCWHDVSLVRLCCVWFSWRTVGGTSLYSSPGTEDPPWPVGHWGLGCTYSWGGKKKT